MFQPREDDPDKTYTSRRTFQLRRCTDPHRAQSRGWWGE